MKSNNYNYISFCIILLATWACEKSNIKYKFDERENISVEGLQAQYAVISGKDRVVIDPVVASNKEGDFEYLWGIYETDAQGYNPIMDTIARTKKLDYLVSRTAKNWYLSFRVTNTKTGYAQYFKSTVQIGTQYTRGWYVPKDEASQTDMDFFTTTTNIVPDGKIENAYSLVNGGKLEGKAKMICFFNDYKAIIPGTTTYVNTRSVSLVSEKDIAVMDLSSLNIIRNFGSIFYGTPEKRSMDMIGNNFLMYFLINDGQVYSIVGQGPSTGIFGGRKLKGSEDEPYHMSKYHLMYISSYFFDENSSSFFSASDRNVSLTPVIDNPGTVLAANKNNQKLLYMGTKTTSPLQGYAIFQDKTDPSIKTVVQVNPSVQSFRMASKHIIDPTEKLYHGKHFAVLYQDENMMYFSVGNEVWSRNLSNHFEQLQYTVPEGEEITFIRHRKFAGTGSEAPYAYNYIMVGTRSGGNYKIRMFTKTSGNLAAQAAFELEGKGSAVDALYVGPPINNMSYPYTY